MIWFLALAVVAAVAVVIPELFTDDNGNKSLNIRDMFADLQSRHLLLETELNRLRIDLSAANKQLLLSREKETEFVAKIFAQRKDLDAKNQECERIVENSKTAQEKVFQMEKYIELLRRQNEKASIELKVIKDENELLRNELTAATHGKRKKIVHTAAS